MRQPFNLSLPSLVRCWWILLLTMACAVVWAQGSPPAKVNTPANPIVLTSTSTHVNLGTRVQRWVDASRSATFEQAQKHHASGDFKLAPGSASAGFTLAAHWLRVEVAPQATARSDWILNIGAPYLNDVQVWAPGLDGQWQQQQRGDRFSKEAPPFAARAHAVRLSLPPGQTSVIWVRVQTTSVMNVTLDLWQPESYAGDEAKNTLVYGSFVTLLLLTTLVFGCLGLGLKDRVLLAFAGYMSTLFVAHFCHSGALLLMFPVRPWWASDMVVGFGALYVIPMANFLWIEVLDMRRNFPRLGKAYKWTAWAILLTPPLYATDHYAVLANLLFLMVIPIGLGNAYGATSLWLRRRDALNLIYVVAFLVALLGSFATVALLLGLLPRNALTVSAYPVSSALTALIMTVAMIMRMAGIQREKQLAEQGIALAAAHADNQRRFVAMLTHEFRNPLTGIDRAANMLESMQDMSADQATQRLGGIRTQVSRLNTLVDSFLLSEAMDHRGVTPQWQSTAVEPYLQDVKRSLGSEMQARVEVSASPAALQARLDVRLLSLALHNLLDNALRYAPESTKVGLAATMVQNQLRIDVWDAGPGLTDEELTQLGTPYYRASSAVGTQGTGLGYHFCRNLAQTLGGRIEATNRSEGGLCVSVYLPQ
jgi:two-component system, sensor histidine kinase LadS